MATVTLKYRTSTENDPEIADIGWLWVLRIYASGRVPLNQFGMPPVHLLPLMEKYGEEHDNPNPLDFDHDVINVELKRFEEKNPTIHDIAGHNIRLITEAFKLSPLEKEVLEFRSLLKLHRGLEETLEFTSQRWTDNLVHQIISIALNKPKKSIVEALSVTGRLAKSGLITLETGLRMEFASKLSVMDGLVSAISRPSKDINELFSFALIKSQNSTLSIDDYSHHKQDIELVFSYLKHTKKQLHAGVNILLYGEPGVGKSELARLIANKLSMTAYEVEASPTGAEVEKEDGQLHERFRSYQVVQNLLSQQCKNLIIFDEIEDVIPRPGLLEKQSSGRKAWLNNLLETNPVPTIWISNHVYQIDPALMRRFDLILEVKNLPRGKRIALLQRSLESRGLSKQWMEKVTDNQSLTPAITNRILSVIDRAKIKDVSAIEKHFEKQIAERNSAQGITKSRHYPKPRNFDLSLLNTNTDIPRVIAGVKNVSSAKILFYGPPGTGKTALAYHLADYADKPLLQKRSSDLISPWIGETEKNLMKMFDEATESDAVLLLDEADSFLNSRHSAKHQWEVTQINELLTQMENYQGILVCATNFMEHLDQAALRRFQFKIKFDYLSADQAIRYFEYVSKAICSDIEKVPYITSEISNVLKSIRNITPADFQQIIEQSQILNVQFTRVELLQELKKIGELKDDKQSAIGFMH